MVTQFYISAKLLFLLLFLLFFLGSKGILKHICMYAAWVPKSTSTKVDLFIINNKIENIKTAIAAVLCRDIVSSCCCCKKWNGISKSGCNKRLFILHVVVLRSYLCTGGPKGVPGNTLNPKFWAGEHPKNILGCSLNPPPYSTGVNLSKNYCFIYQKTVKYWFFFQKNSKNFLNFFTILGHFSDSLKNALKNSIINSPPPPEFLDKEHPWFWPVHRYDWGDFNVVIVLLTVFQWMFLRRSTRSWPESWTPWSLDWPH